MADGAKNQPTADADDAASLRACPCCGLIQRAVDTPPGWQLRCARCATRLHDDRGSAAHRHRTAALALAALVLYPPAVGLPMLEIEQFGHQQASSVIDGTATLLSQGHYFVGLIVLVCSVILPVAKLIGLLALSLGGPWLRSHHRAWTYRFVEWTGRWGMLDVLAVAVLVAVVKLGQTVSLTAGPAALAFTLVVLLSLLAAATFDEHALWDEHEESEPSTPSPSPLNEGTRA